ncbi:unnamed protein product, partial [Rotaria sordida]
MIFKSNYKIIKYNRTRDQTMCLRRQPYTRKHCQDHGCIDDYKNNFIDKSCANEELILENCEKYCQYKHQCLNETEQVILLVPILREPQLIEIYIKKFSRKRQLSKNKNEFVKLIALNFAAVREKAAIVQVYEDMLLIIMAAGLIIGITICYLQNANMLLNSTNIRDDVPSNQQKNPSKLKRSSSHHLFLCKHSEEIRKILLNEEALMEIMSNTLKHAVFGIFIGICVLIYFAITFTAIAAFAEILKVIYEKHIQNMISHVLSMYFTDFMNKSANSALAKLYHRFSSTCRYFRNYIFGHFMPLINIKLRYVLVLIFLLMGILEDKRLFTCPAVSFVFDIRDIDDGYIFDMNDRGRLHLMPLYLVRDDILVAKVINDRVKLNVSKTNHLNMIKYIRKINKNLIDSLISNTVRTIDYKTENDQSDHDGYIDKKLDQINLTLYKISNKQLKNRLNPIIIYSNYRKSFNRTLERIYKEQIQSNYDVNQTRISINNTLRDALTDEYQCSALKTAMQCITGAAGADNVPTDFCNRILTKQRSFNWAVLPDKSSSIDGNVRPFAVLITIRGVHNRTDYNSYNEYYMNVKNFFNSYIKQHAPEHLKHAWFSSPNFAFYGVQRELLSGSSSSLLVSLGIALVVLFLTSGNLFIAVYALITVTFAIAITVGVFVVLEWELGIIEGIVIVMAVGLSVDFVVH